MKTQELVLVALTRKLLSPVFSILPSWRVGGAALFQSLLSKVLGVRQSDQSRDAAAGTRLSASH